MKPFLIITFSIIIAVCMVLAACKNNTDSLISEYDPNLCTQYSCPLHKDKMSVTLDICPECGIQMIDADRLDSYLFKTAQSIYDSINHFNKQILKYSYIISNADSSKWIELNYAYQLSNNVNKARTANQNLDKLVFGKNRIIMKPHQQNIDRLYAVATYRVTTLIKELEKPGYQKPKVKLYTQELIETIYEVDKEQAMLKVKSSDK
jgi:hypothetical protein